MTKPANQRAPRLAGDRMRSQSRRGRGAGSRRSGAPGFAVPPPPDPAEAGFRGGGPFPAGPGADWLSLEAGQDSSEARTAFGAPGGSRRSLPGAGQESALCHAAPRRAAGRPSERASESGVRAGRPSGWAAAGASPSGRCSSRSEHHGPFAQPRARGAPAGLLDAAARARAGPGPAAACRPDAARALTGPAPPPRTWGPAGPRR